MLKDASCVKTKMVKLDPYQEIALSNIDALKEEMVNIVRKKRDSGKDSFDLIPEKQNKLHDDRFYCACLAAYWLSEKRRENITSRKRNGSMKDILDKLVVSNGKHIDKIFG
jgi:hypothetical protein